MTLRRVRETWTYRNFSLVVAMSLCLVIVLQEFDLSVPEAAAVEYVAPKTPADYIEAEIEKRTAEIVARDMAEYQEESRLKAIREINAVLLDKIDESPYIDYDAMYEKYGY